MDKSIGRTQTQRYWFKAPYNPGMADSIACSCVTCPKCGTWVVVKQQTEAGVSWEKFRTSCPAPECGKEFNSKQGRHGFSNCLCFFLSGTISTALNCANCGSGCGFILVSRHELELACE